MGTVRSGRNSYQETVNKYRVATASKIPQSLRLHPSYLESLLSISQSVIDVPKQCGLLTDVEVDITENYDAVALLEKIATKQFSSAMVTTAFCKRAAIAQQLVNCLTETMFEEAFDRASFCDDYLAREGKLLGPFHGLPISLTDSFNIKDVRSTIGYVDFCRKDPASENSALVEILLAQGAVLYTKTNVPQTLMAADTHNNVFGRTLNPWRTGLTAGGTSGGEAALLAMRGSVLGVGTDIAGGIRIPALCCGVISLKPSCNRIPLGGQTIPGRRGAFGIHASAGPLCHSVRDAEYFMRSVLAYDVWTLDENVLSVPWIPSRIGSPKPRTFGVIIEDPRYPLHPPALRNFQIALKKLANVGHRLIPIHNKLPHDVIASTALTSMTILNMDPEKTAVGYVARGGEPLVPSTASSTMPELERMKPNINGVFHLNTSISNLRATFRKVIVENKLDAIIMPVFEVTAVPHDSQRVPAYALLANILDYPACVLPFGKAEKTADAQFVRDLQYSPELNPDFIEGAPYGIQILGRNMKDEDLLENAHILEVGLKS